MNLTSPHFAKRPGATWVAQVGTVLCEVMVSGVVYQVSTSQTEGSAFSAASSRLI